MMKSTVMIVLLLYLTVGGVCPNLINDKTCGVVTSDNEIHQHPWLVLIEYYLNGRRALIRCGGTLVSSRHILTSAHCVEITTDVRWNRNITILSRLGEYDISSRSDCVAGVCSDPVIRMVIESIVVHPWFYRDRFSHDLALMILETDAPYTDYIRPICLPSRTSKIPRELYASGFGNLPNIHIPSQIKKNIRLPYFSRCPLHYQQFYKLPKDGFCAGGEENVDTCNGDSGGPIIWVRKDGGRPRAELWGVIKGGTKTCGLKGQPGVYTSVVKNLYWIKKEINITASRINSTIQNGGTERGVVDNRETQNGDSNNQTHSEDDEETSYEDNQNDKNQTNEKHNSGQILFVPNYMLFIMLLFTLFCI